MDVAQRGFHEFLANDPETLVRRSFCVFLAVSLLVTSKTRAQFYSLRCRYIDLVGTDAMNRGRFYTNTFAEVATPTFPMNLIPLGGGWPELGCDAYCATVRSGLLELLLVVSAALPRGTLAAVGLFLSLLLFLHIFGQRKSQMLGLVSGGKDVLLVWSLALLVCGELGASGATRSMQVVLSFAYFIPGITKLIIPKWRGHGWLSWLDGRSLQVVVLERYVLFDSALAWYVGLMSWLCSLGCIVTVIFECAWIAVPICPDVLLPLAVVGLSFHLGCWMVLGINFLPFWVPAYACVVPCLCSVRGPGDKVLAGVSSISLPCACVLAVFLGGCLWYYAELARTGVTPESRIWPLGIAPFYSGYCSGYPPDEHGAITMRAVVLYVTESNIERAWSPKIDVYFARRINAECRVRGVEGARRANLLLLALSEVQGRGATEQEASQAGAAVAGRFSKLRWVEKTFVIGGPTVVESQQEKLCIGKEAVQKEVEAAFLPLDGRR